MVTPIQIMERLKALPEHLQAHNRRFYVEAISDEARAPMIEYYAQEAEAEAAATEWGKRHGAEGFYPPGQAHGSEPRSVYAFDFKREDAPGAPAWTTAGRGFITRPGHVAAYPSKRPAGKAITAELETLPKFPAYATAIDHLDAIADLPTERADGRLSSGGVGLSGGSWHLSVPFEVAGRYFISAVNHNYDIAECAQEAARYLAGENPEWAPSLAFIGDPIGWRPAAGWQFLTKAEVDFIIAEENLRRAEMRRVAA